MQILMTNKGDNFECHNKASNPAWSDFICPASLIWPILPIILVIQKLLATHYGIFAHASISVFSSFLANKFLFLSQSLVNTTLPQVNIPRSSLKRSLYISCPTNIFFFFPPNNFLNNNCVFKPYSPYLFYPRECKLCEGKYLIYLLIFISSCLFYLFVKCFQC